MNQSTTVTPETSRQAEERYFSSYDWCLSPILTVRELIDRLHQEIDRYTTLPTGWQREESKISLYLFTCAIGCTVDDYLSWRPWALAPLGDEYPQIAFLIPPIQGIFNLPFTLGSSRNLSSVRRWRDAWTDYVDRVCHLLLRNLDISPEEISGLRNNLDAMSGRPLPAPLLKRRMKLNEGYRCQDLTHHDVLTMVDRFVEAHPERDAKIVVIGPRTAGAYFAPIAKAHLLNRGFKDVSWFTLRPKRGISHHENETLRRTLTRGSLVLLTDDYSNTGRTFRLVQKRIIQLGVPAGNITVLAPIHPTQPEVPLTLTTETKAIILRHGDLYKTTLMEPREVQPLLREFFSTDTCEDVVVRKNAQIDDINSGLWRHYRDSFQVRLKRVYEVDLSYRDRPSVRKRVLVKSVGWGWLGYHAYVAGMRLKGSVPEIIGLRNGLLFTEWIDGRPWDQQEMAADGPAILSAYIARRTNQLRLKEDPRFQAPDFGWGWMEILRLLRRVYGVYFGYLKKDALIGRLKSIVSPVPSLIDGRMRPDEWLMTDRGAVKLDFEHHNFGAPEFDIVDPAYDLAGTAFEFRTSDADLDTMVRIYAAETGDRTVPDRLLLYKLLYATLARRRTLERLQKNSLDEDQEALNQRYLWCWNFPVFTMTRFSSGLIRNPGQQGENGQLLFIDLDGVLDSEVLGFPHTTTSGLYALALLQANGFTVLPNTGRNIEHVRHYCSSYKFPLAVAEYGSVIFDANQQTEFPLIDAEVTDQLLRCREALKTIPGVFIDSGYRYSVRAYRFNSKRTVGLNPREATQLLNNDNLDRLKCITRADDTYFVGANTDKGNAIPRVRELLPSSPRRLIAIGDSDEDVAMLRIADDAFSPRNSSSGIRALAERSACRIVSEARQRGLLQVTQSLLERGSHPERDSMLDAGVEGTVHNLMFSLMAIAEQSRTRRFMTIFARGHL